MNFCKLKTNLLVKTQRLTIHIKEIIFSSFAWGPSLTWFRFFPNLRRNVNEKLINSESKPWGKLWESFEALSLSVVLKVYKYLGPLSLNLVILLPCLMIKTKVKLIINISQISKTFLGRLLGTLSSLFVSLGNVHELLDVSDFLGLWTLIRRFSKFPYHCWAFE